MNLLRPRDADALRAELRQVATASGLPVVFGGQVHEQTLVLSEFLGTRTSAMPGRPVVLPLESEDGVHAGITRRSLRAAVRDAADSVPGLESARVRLGSKKIRVKGRTHEAAAEAAGSVRAAIDERLDLVAPRVRHTVTTRVRPTDAGGTR